MIRLDLPGYSGAKSLQPISWTEWFRQFDDNDLALLVQDTTSRGQRSNFNKLVSRRGTTRGPSTSRKRAERRGAARARKTARSGGARRRTSASRASARTTSRSRTARTRK